jgi:hypothetical protein
MMFKLVDAAQKSWRRLYRHNQSLTLILRCQVHRPDQSRRQPGTLKSPNRRRLNLQAITKIRR